MKVHSFRDSHSNPMGLETQFNNRVLIKIPLDNEDCWQKEYNQNELVGKIIQDFKSENFIDIPDDYFLDFYFQNKTLNINDPIKSLINYEIPTLYINQVVKKKPLKITTNLQSNFPNFVGRPFSNPFEVYLFSTEDTSLKIQIYNEEIINNLLLNDFSPSSAYCNGNNHLFISGGERPNGELIDYFWEIELKEQIIAEPTKIIPKKNHSMIFIPDKYVFIIGGNDKRCIYFNTETAEVEEWDNLNKKRVEPALQLINNYLYCFDSVNYKNNEIFTIEKTDLDSLRPKWILLAPKIGMVLGNYITFDQQNFGVAKDDDDNIIFIGGNMVNQYRKFNYKYNTKENKIEITNILFSESNLKEKTFLPLKKHVDFILPNFDRDKPEVLFLIKNKNKTEKINYQPKEAQTKIPEADYKYDFNMPKIAVPDPISSFNFDQDNINNILNSNSNLNYSNNDNINGNNNININNNIDKNIKINNIDTNNNLNIEFDDYNHNEKNINNEIPNAFQEPEIEPAKEDLKLSFELQNNNLLNNDIKINTKEDNVKILDINKKEEEAKLNGISFKSINDKKEIEIDTNIKSINTNNIFKDIDFSKDYYNAGTIIGNKSYKLNGNMNSNIKENVKEIEIKNSDVNLNKEINNYNNNIENKTYINNISTNINTKAINNNNYLSQNKNISPIDINTQNNPKTNVKVNIQEPKYQINTKQISSMPDYNLNGNIPGTKKTIYIANDKNNKNKVKESKELFKLSGIIRGTGSKLNNVKDKNQNNIKKDINITTGIIPGVKPNIQKEKKLSIPKLNLEGKIQEYNDEFNIINNKPHMIDLRGDNNVNIQSYENNYNSPTFNYNLNKSKKENTIELNGENNNLSTNNGNIQGSKMEFSSFDNLNFKEIQFEQKNLGKRIGNLNINEENIIKTNIPNKSINANLGQININNKRDKEKKNSDNENIIISGIIPGIQVSKHPFVNSPNNKNNKNILESKNINNIQNGNSNSINNNIYKTSEISNINNNFQKGNSIHLLNSMTSEINNSINKQNTKAKNKNLPLVGEKTNIFISSKVEPINCINTNNIDINNLKSSNAGINGIKLGERIEE